MNVGSRRVVVATVSVLVAAAAAAAVLALLRPAQADSSATPAPTASRSASPTPTATPAPSTPAPPSPTAPDPTQAPPATPAPTAGATDAPLGGATVTVTFSGWDAAGGAAVVGGYVDALEPAGSCTVSMTRGNSVVTRSAAATPDATTMSCGELSVPRSALTTGAWQAVLSYSSPSRAGSAPAVTIEVP